MPGGLGETSLADVTIFAGSTAIMRMHVSAANHAFPCCYSSSAVPAFSMADQIFAPGTAGVNDAEVPAVAVAAM